MKYFIIFRYLPDGSVCWMFAIRAFYDIYTNKSFSDFIICPNWVEIFEHINIGEKWGA